MTSKAADRAAELRAELEAAYAMSDIYRVSHVRGRIMNGYKHASNRKASTGELMDWQEAWRRADRALGLLIRKGQAEGQIREPGQSKVGLPSPSDFITGGKLNVELYDLTDQVSDERFEEALVQARKDGTLSRAHLIRVLGPRSARSWISDVGDVDPDWIPASSDHRTQASHQRRRLITRWAAEGRTSRQMEELMGTSANTIRRIARQHDIAIQADESTAHRRHLDSDKIVAELAVGMEGLAMTAGLVTPGDLDKSQIPQWVASLRSSLRVIGQLVKDITAEETK